MGSGGSSWSKVPREIAKEIRETERKVENSQFQTDLSGLLGKLLARYNDRDIPLVRNRLDDILKLLADSIDEKLEQLFGGSVAKHTYVDGFSDIDCLLVINDTSLEAGSPKFALEIIEKALKGNLTERAEIRIGKLAATVQYMDGMEIQLLPAIKTLDGLKISSSRNETQWSKIDPHKFQAALVKYNEKCNSKLVPTIKLAKAIIAQWPEAIQLSGYHIESLAIDAFKNYTGAKTTVSMLPHFFNHAKGRVVTPMTDSTGQSVHVDDYMGAADSPERKNASHLLGRIAKRMINATASASLDQWAAMFGED